MRTRSAMALIGGLQGLALYALRVHSPEGPAQAPFFALVFFIIAAAAVGHFARSGANAARLCVLAAVSGLLFGVVAYGIAAQLPPPDAAFSGDRSRLWTWWVGAALALFVLGPFVQILQTTGRFRFPYGELYRHAWNNFFVAVLAAIFNTALRTMLWLWGLLFGLIGVDFFQDLFTSKASAYLVTGAALGYGIAAARESERMIATLRNLTQTLLRSLLPILAAVTIVFLATLPFTGLNPLFATQRAASVLMGWLALQILLFNAVYLDGNQAPPYQPWLRRLVEVGAVIAPVLAIIAGYAIALRIDQHGLTPDRVIASAIAVVLGLYVSGYAVAVWKRGAPWLPLIRSVNVGMAWFVIAVVVGLHTRIGDPLRLSVSNQLARLASGAVDPAEFDYAFLRFELGHAGYEALQRLSQTPVSDQVDLRIRIALTEQHEHLARMPIEAPESIEHRFLWLAQTPPWPPGFRYGLLREDSWFKGSGCSELNPCEIFSTDIDRDGRLELAVAEIDMGTVVILQQKGEEVWLALGYALRRSKDGGAPDSEALRRAVRSGEVEVVEPQYGELLIGGTRYRFSP